MLTKLRIRNFKQFDDVEIELGQRVVFVGPNNSGKTTALQALSLWYTAYQFSQNEVDALKTFSKFLGRVSQPVLINRYDFVSFPIVDLQSLWPTFLMDDPVEREIIIQVNGMEDQNEWQLRFIFAFENGQALAVQAEPTESSVDNLRVPIIMFLPPMSGLAITEPLLTPGRINVLIGEGRTAEVLRNLCYTLYETSPNLWMKVVLLIEQEFGVTLSTPRYTVARGELGMQYTTRDGYTLDISSSGRGMLQVLLLLVYLYNNPGAVILLDEPDAHLEIIRQRAIYTLLSDTAREQNAQLIIATHSEVVVDEAAGKDIVVALSPIGQPKRIDTRTAKGRQERVQFEKALRDIRAVDYYQADLTGWILYLEGSTDLEILRRFAQRLKHPASELFERAFVHYVESNQPQIARDHFYGLRAAKPNLGGIAIFDRIDKQLPQEPLTIVQWRRREIENYLSQPETVIAFAAQNGNEQAQVMDAIVRDRVAPVALRDRQDRFWYDTKMSDDFLPGVFEAYFTRLQLPNVFYKTNYHILTDFVPDDQIDPEIGEKLDAIVAVAQQARPVTE